MTAFLKKQQQQPYILMFFLKSISDTETNKNIII